MNYNPTPFVQHCYYHFVFSTSKTRKDITKSVRFWLIALKIHDYTTNVIINHIYKQYVNKFTSLDFYVCIRCNMYRVITIKTQSLATYGHVNISRSLSFSLPLFFYLSTFSQTLFFSLSLSVFLFLSFSFLVSLFLSPSLFSVYLLSLSLSFFLSFSFSISFWPMRN